MHRILRTFAALAVLLLGALHAVESAVTASEGRQVLSMDEGWRFHLDDIPVPPLQLNQSADAAKAGNARGAAAHRYDDTAWRTVRLPHDWAVEGPFDPQANGDQGYRPRGFGWYRKTFQVPSAWRGKNVELQCDGIATHATVWVNGIEMHQSRSGYTAMALDLTPVLTWGEEVNTIAVRVDAERIEGWWYEGAGMIRSTRLVVRPSVHIATDGLWANPVLESGDHWRLPVELTIDNSGIKAAEATVEVRLSDPEGREVARRSTTASIAALDRAVVAVPMTVDQPRRWSMETPQRYTVEARLTVAGSTDVAVVRCGFRTIRFDAQQGFFLNERPVKIKGTCNHLDHLGVGTAVPDSLWEFRLRRLKEMGSNAYRSSHNPAPAAVLELCDQMGLLVMDENRMLATSTETTSQLEWMVRRGRNHPSVILWSVFNEEPLQAAPQGQAMTRRLVAAVKRLDPTRPVTAAMNGGHLVDDGAAAAVDVTGFNYRHLVYDAYHAAHPQQPMISTEDASAFQTRGEYTTDAAQRTVTSYDDTAASWGLPHAASWKAIADRPFLAGGFVWTGFDYRGEPTPYDWPSAGSFFGCMDQAGFPKAAYYVRQALWITDRPVLQVIPHWNWAGREGQPIRVQALTNATHAELLVNGVSQGEKAVDPVTMATWMVPYQPGRLEVVARRDGKEVARQVVATTGTATRLVLVPDRADLAGDGRDAMPVTIQAVDAEGRVVPGAAPMVTLALTGPLRLLGLGNGDPNNHEPEQADHHTLFHGLGQAIVQADLEAGAATIRATAPGLEPATVTIPVRSVPRPAHIPASPHLGTLKAWKLSPWSADRPDPLAKAPLAMGIPGTWGWVDAPHLVRAETDGWYQWRGFAKPFLASQHAQGGVLKFVALHGVGEIWFDGALAFTKTDPAPAAVAIPFAAGTGEHPVVILLRAPPGQPVGLGGPVLLENRTTP